MKIRKRTRAGILCLAAALAAGTLTGCGTGEVQMEKVTLITGEDGVDAEGVYSEMWNGISQYAAQRGCEASWYQPEAQTAAGIETAIRKAADDGATVVLCTGTQASIAVQEMQREEKQISFLIMEGEPTNAETGEVQYRGNTSGVFLETAEAGFLAGYAAVQEGYRNLGFLAGKETKENIAYGSGFLQGANQAATELELADGSISIRYQLRGNESISPTSQNEINSWYQEGCELIYACGPAAEFLALAAANSCGGVVIDTNVTESSDDTHLLSSAGMDYCQAAEQVLSLLANGEIKGGKTLHLDASCGCLGLQLQEGAFTRFTQDQYQEIIARIASGDVKISDKDAYANAADMNLTKLTL